MTTALDLITLALKTAGVLAAGITPAAEDVNDSFLVLNGLMASWNQNRWWVYHLVDIATPATGVISYTVGPGGNFNVTRPDRLESAYVRMMPQGIITPNTVGSGPIDYPLAIMETHEEYGRIGQKSLVSFPSVAFYDATLTLGTLYVWPIPNEQFELHIIVKETLPQFATLTSQINLPPEYFEALYYNLVGRLSLLYQLPINPGVVALATAGLNAIKVANHRVPNLRMPAGITRQGGWATHGVGGIIEGTFTLEEDTIG